jgi:pimeloyl-ACP methyl ester carboxylesterase
MHDEADAVLPEVLAEAALECPLLVGHSDGASIALLYAGAGNAVAGLVLLAPHVVVEDITVSAIAAARAAYEDDDLRSRLARYHDDVDNTFWGWSDVWMSPAFRSWDITDRLPAIAAPMLLIQGDADPYGTLVQLDLIEAAVAGDVRRVVLPGVGHSPHHEARQQTVEAIAEFAGEFL